MNDLWSLIKQPMVFCLITAFAVATMNPVFAQNQTLSETTVSLVRVAEDGNVTCNAQPSHTFFYMAQPNRRHAVVALEGRTLELKRQALKRLQPRQGTKRYGRRFTHRGSNYRIRMTLYRGEMKRITIIEKVGIAGGSCTFRFKN